MEAEDKLEQKRARAGEAYNSLKADIDRAQRERGTLSLEKEREVGAELQHLNALLDERRRELEDYEEDLQMIRQTFQDAPSRSILVRSEVISSKELGGLLVLSVLLLALDLMLATTRPIFPVLMCSSLQVLLFLVNYYERLYNRLCAVVCLASLLYEVTWLALNFGQWWTPSHGELKTGLEGWYRWILVLTILLLPVRLVCLVMLYRAREGAEVIAGVCGWGVRLGD